MHGVHRLSGINNGNIGTEPFRAHMVNQSKAGLEVVETVLILRLQNQGGKVIEVSNVKIQWLEQPG